MLRGEARQLRRGEALAGEDLQQLRPEDSRSARDRLPFDDESPLQPSPTIPVIDALPLPREMTISVPLGRHKLAVGGANGWDSRL